ncbi:MAG: APC family permease [Dehalococcoidales bacterium]|nr:APC family permease [Dehalococcoidales bacterium]
MNKDKILQHQTEMNTIWHPKPGDNIFRPQRTRHFHLRRVLGVAAVFSAGYGNVGSSIYYALGIVALFALGATPIALGAAGVLFIFTALTYAEGTATLPEAGGSASFARHAFNDPAGFAAGWALMLSYIVTISISAFTIPPYLSYFWEPFKNSPIVSTVASMVIVGLLMLVNVIGVKETSFVNVGAAVLDIATQVSLIIIGFILIFDPPVLISRIFDNWPSTENLVLGIALASLAYTGVETVSQMSEETKQPEKKVPRALFMMIITVLVLFAGISLVSLSAMPPQELASEWSRDPVAGIAAHLPVESIRNLLEPMIAILAGTILLIATNAGLIGISRLAFSLGTYKLVPPAFSRVHPRFKTPHVAIILFSTIAIVLLIPGFFAPDVFKNMGALYTFGSLLSFMFAHASIIMLRIKKPDLPRPFKLKGNIKIRGRELPVTTIIGFVATAAIWTVILITQAYSRWVGLGWMVLGLAVYYLYQKHLRAESSRKGNVRLVNRRVRK